MNRPSVLALRALGLGDFLAGVPAYRALRTGHPDHEIVLAAPAALAPLVPLAGAIDRLLPTGELAEIQWPGPPPSLAVDLHGSGPASHRLVEATGALECLMYASPSAPDVAGPWWDANEHEVIRWCRLLRWSGLDADPSSLDLLRPPQPPLIDHAVIVHPGASSGSRRWPPGRFAAVSRRLAADGARVVITGSPRERPLAEQVAAEAGLESASVIAGRLGLADLAALVAAAALVVGGDTGISHLATAYGTPSVTLFGPVSPALWGPPPNRERHVALWKGGDIGRPGDAHAEETDPRLLQITVAEVLEAARGLAESVPQPT